jgi:SHS2 domain-containing protein
MSRRPSYQEIEHTADVGFELTAPDLKSAFETAAAAMFDLICDLDTVGDGIRRSVRVGAREADLENMMVRWLTELLYVLEAEGLLLSYFDVRKLESDVIEAGVAGEPIDYDHHSIKAEIKAATYHELAVEKLDGEWFVRVIFDT